MTQPNKFNFAILIKDNGRQCSHPKILDKHQLVTVELNYEEAIKNNIE